MNAILFVSHGSREPEARAEIERLLRKLKEKSGTAIVRYAFLDVETPNIPEGIRQCAQEGASTITVLLNFLNSGRHASADIPKIIRRTRQKYPEIKFRITKPLAQHDALVDIFLKLLNEQTDLI